MRVTLTNEQREQALVRVRDNLLVYIAFCLKIRDKSGKLVQFHLNRAQLHIHEALEKQKAETGKVRALILKGRQQGACPDASMLVLTADLR